MRIAQIRESDIANGEGIRVSLFVTGCHFNCKNCFNKEYQDFNYGNLVDSERLSYRLAEYLNKPYIQGLTILGGEPMEHPVELYDMLKNFKAILEEPKDVWIYSGYTIEQIARDPKKLKLLRMCDIIVDGKFEEDKKDLTLKYRGSSNQRIINIKEWLKENEI